MAEPDLKSDSERTREGQKCDLFHHSDITWKCKDNDELVCKFCDISHQEVNDDVMKSTPENKQTPREKPDVDCLFHTKEDKLNTDFLKSTPESKLGLIEKKSVEINCHRHPNEHAQMFCRTCDVPICRLCIVQSSHQVHPIVLIEDILENKRIELVDMVVTIKEKLTKQDNITNYVNKMQLDHSAFVSARIKDVKKRNEILKTKLDQITSEYVKLLEDLERNKRIKMKRIKASIQRRTTQLKDLLQQCETTQKNVQDVQLVYFVSDAKATFNGYVQRELQPPEIPPRLIIPTDDEDRQLRRLFGTLTIVNDAKNDGPPPLQQTPELQLPARKRHFLRFLRRK